MEVAVVRSLVCIFPEPFPCIHLCVSFIMSGKWRVLFVELLFSYVEYIELKETWCNWVAVTRWYRRDGCTLPYSVLIFFFYCCMVFQFMDTLSFILLSPC